jgi:hypothetical protein
MKKIIKKILKEDRGQMFLNKIVHVMKNDFPLIKNMKDYGFYEQLTYDELDYVLSGLFGVPVKKNGDDPYNHNQIHVVYDNNGNQLYYEEPNGKWQEWQYDENGKIKYVQNWRGGWEKRKYGKLKTIENKNWSMDVLKYTEKLNYDDNEVEEHIIKPNGDILDLDNPSLSGRYWIEWGDGEIEHY